MVKFGAAIASLARDYREYTGDDLQREGTRSFIDLVNATEVKAQRHPNRCARP